MLQALEEKIESLKQEVDRRNGGWGWEDGEDMESMNTDSPAIFGVPNHSSPHPANNQNYKVSHQVSCNLLFTVSVQCCGSSPGQQ
jgi:hypothetical protein